LVSIFLELAVSIVLYFFFMLCMDINIGEVLVCKYVTTLCP
jgi:hypothetical protein